MTIQEFKSDDGKRVSYIDKVNGVSGNGFILFCYEGELKKNILFMDKSLQYVEDTAENRTLYIPE